MNGNGHRRRLERLSDRLSFQEGDHSDLSHQLDQELARVEVEVDSQRGAGAWRRIMAEWGER